MDDGPPDVVPSSRRVNTGGRSIREHAARGTVVNGLFLVGLSIIGLVKGFLIAGFLTRDDYGIWGILIVGLGTLGALKQIGIGDRYIQQDEEDQEVAFQKAFTLEAIFTMGFMVVMLIAVPLIALLYRRWQIVLPGYAALLILPAGILQAPLWVYYREMDFVKQRLLQAAEPVVGLVVSLGLAIAGAGYWSLVIGVLAGAWTTAVISVRASPYKLKFRYEPGTVHSYAAFSWPLLVTSIAVLFMTQASILMPNLHLGLAAAGSITLASTVTQFTDRVDQIVTGTLYPAICAAKDKIDVLAESFVKSNRLALMWAMPFGVGVSLFAGDLVHFGIGNRWTEAIGPLEVFGVTSAIGHIGYNWDAYFRANDTTRPIAIATVISVIAFFIAGVPLLFAYGLVGLSLGVSAHVVALLICRGYYLSKMFNGFGIIWHAARAMLPTIPAAVLVILMRVVERGPRTRLEAAGEIAAYVVVTIVATAGTERPLMREALAYLRGRPVTALAA